jgi:anthranilate/para-aminobenzoate synthase component I
MKSISTYIQEDFKLSHKTSIHHEQIDCDKLLHYVCDKPEKYEYMFNQAIKQKNNGPELMTIRWKEKNSSDDWSIEFFITEPAYNLYAHAFFNDVENIRTGKSYKGNLTKKWNIEQDTSDKYKWTYIITHKETNAQFSIFVNMTL